MAGKTINWENEISKQISVYKTDKSLIELVDSLKPSSKNFPAHIHARGEKSENKERSLVRIQMLDYSKGRGDNCISVFANISPQEARFLFSKVHNGALFVSFPQTKIFGTPDEQGYSIVTKLTITRSEKDNNGTQMKYPWRIIIENGRGKAMKNKTGGKYLGANTYVCDSKVSVNMVDLDFYILFCDAVSYIQAFEIENAFRAARVKNFESLYGLLNKQINVSKEELLKAVKDESNPLNKLDKAG